MSTNPKNYKAQHLFVQNHFGWEQADYTTTVIMGKPGLRIEKDGNLYQVETLAERETICRGQVATMGNAMWVPTELAVEMLKGAEQVPGFLERLLDVLEDEAGTSPARTLEQKGKAAFANARAQQDVPFWEAIAKTDAELLGAGLVALDRLVEGREISEKLANLYYTNSELLCEIEDGDAGHGISEGVKILLYEVW
jgi:hypothetical protein